MGMGKLNAKRAIFCKEYIVDLNATQAAIRAGYSERTAYSQGQRLLKDVECQAEIQRLMQKRSKKLEITAERVLEELAKLGFSNSQDLYDEKGKLIPVHKLPRDVAATIQEITEDTIGGNEDGVVTKRKYKTACKKSSLDLIGRHLKLFTDKVEHSGKDGESLAPILNVTINKD